MGIIRLADFLKKKLPQVMRHRLPENYSGKLLAVDASSTIYSFLAKTITYTKSSQHVNIPTDAHGNMTGHLIGLLYRALFCKELKINTVWVFDGKPPIQKSEELYRRRQIKEQAAEKAMSAIDEGDVEEAVKQSKRTIYVRESEREDAKKLISLMGLPVIQAKSEAEAQCAWLTKNKLVQGVIGQDIDTIVFGGETLIKSFNRSDIPIELNLSSVLSGLELTYQQFIDFCILCGCDYTSKVPQIGPVKALSYLKQQGNIEGVLRFINQSNKLRPKHPIPDDFNYLIARRLFTSPQVRQVTMGDLVQKPFQEGELKSFLLQKDFNEKRIDNWIELAKKFDEANANL